MEESVSNSMFSRESNRLTNLIGSADAPLLYGFGALSLSFSFPFFLSGQLSWFFIVLGFNDTSTLVGHLCRLPEKGRKVIEEIVEEIKERDREERNRNESEETEEIKIFPIYTHLLQG